MYERRSVYTEAEASTGKCEAGYKRKNTRKNRGRNAVNQSAAFLVSGLCLAVALAIVFGSFLSKAEAKDSKTRYYKYYANVQVQSGDTLWDLASDYMDEHYESRQEYIQEVRKLNSLPDSDSIVSGQYLILPYYSTEYKV